MEKKEVSLQIATLLVFGGGLLTFYFFDLKTSLSLFNALIITVKPWVFWIGIFCFIPPIINLISQTFSSKQKYNNKPYYMALRFLVHLSFILIGIFILAWLWALSMIGLVMIGLDAKFTILWTIILVFLTIFIIDVLCQRYFKIHWYNIFYHFKK